MAVPVSAVRRQLKAFGTALKLDTRAAAAMVHEAGGLAAPVLNYCALGDC